MPPGVQGVIRVLYSSANMTIILNVTCRPGVIYVIGIKSVRTTQYVGVQVIIVVNVKDDAKIG